MIRAWVVVALCVGCGGKTDPDELVAGEYRFSPSSASTGTCGEDLARQYFGAGTGWDVTIEFTSDGFVGTDHVRQGLFEGSGLLTCTLDGDNFTCEIYDGAQPQGTLAATLYVYATATGRWTDATHLEGLWEMDADCEGVDCEQVGANYGTAFPCDFGQPFEAELTQAAEDEEV